MLKCRVGNYTCGVLDIRELQRRLRVLREHFRLTQHDVAALAGIDYKFYQQIESPRKKQIWLETVVRLAAVYELELWQFFHPQFLAHSQRRAGRVRALVASKKT